MAGVVHAALYDCGDCIWALHLHGEALGEADRWGRTPLHAAAAANTWKAARALLAAGVDPEAVTVSQETATATARRWGHLDLAELIEAASSVARRITGWPFD